MTTVPRPRGARAPRLAFALGALGFAAAGCASSAALDAAAGGRLPALRAELAAEGAKGRLPGEARVLARATAAGEIARAAGADGLDRMRELEACARSLEEALDHKAEGQDEVAAAATMALLEAGLVDGADLRAKAGAPGERGAAIAPEAGWRAVGARALVRARDAGRRRELLADGDRGVRLAAVRASADAADPDDVDALFDVARQDPAPLARTLAVRALARIGGDHVVARLSDLWPSADEPLRDTIVAAWAAPRARDLGGRAKLVAAVERQKGVPAISAAALVAVDGGASPTERGEATAVLLRAIAAGSPRERAHAIAVAPDVFGVRDAVLAAAADREPAVAVAALARRLDRPADPSGAPPGSPDRKPVVAKLLELATSAPVDDALRARAALARAGEGAVGPLLERGLTSPDTRVREASAAAFVRLGRPSRAAFLLADEDAHVRTATACALLSRP